ncbi:hypothetical protein [Scytonema sp. NUACC26]|uniref:hypothetical protein n=1 Tax=Scytonema sp. NUACC26 TaxID=3140176 RepID=UPI0038B3DAF0
MYLTEEQVKHLFALIYQHFPSSYFVFDSLSHFMVKHQKQHDAMKYYEARFQWGIKDVRNINNWNSHYQVLQVKTLYDTPPRYYRRMGFINNLIFRVPPFSRMYRLSLVQLS